MIHVERLHLRLILFEISRVITNAYPCNRILRNKCRCQSLGNTNFNAHMKVTTFFVCWGVFVRLANFSLIWRRHHYRWRTANFDLCSALIASEQWGFFSVPYLLWQGASVNNGHQRTLDTHTSCRAFSSGAVTICSYDLGLSRLGFEHPTFRPHG